MWPVKRPPRLTKYNNDPGNAQLRVVLRQTTTSAVRRLLIELLKNPRTAATAALRQAPASAFRKSGRFHPASATMLFFPLFLLGRSSNLHERGGGLRDLRLLLFRLLGFTVTTNLTFRHRNSPLKRLAGCEHSITRSAGVSVQSRPIRSNSWG